MSLDSTPAASGRQEPEPTERAIGSSQPASNLDGSGWERSVEGRPAARHDASERWFVGEDEDDADYCRPPAELIADRALDRSSLAVERGEHLLEIH
jgi:hypothetical protein